MDRRTRLQFWMEFMIDTLSLVVSNVVSFLVANFLLGKINEYPRSTWLSYWGMLILSFFIVFFGFHSTINLHKRDRIAELKSAIKNCVPVYLLFFGFLIFARNNIFEARIFITLSSVLFFLLSTAGRYYLKRWITGQFTESKVASFVGVLSTTDRIEDFVEGLKEDWSIKITGVALLDNYVENGNFSFDEKLLFGNEYTETKMKAKKKIKFPHVIAEEIPVIATDNRFLDWIRSAPLDEIFINLPYTKSEDVAALVEEIEEMGITVHLNVPALDKMLDESSFDNINCKVYSGYPIATFSATVHDDAGMVAKRIIDVLAGIVGIILSIPIIAVVAIPLLIESPGPLFFKQERVGKNGRIFNIYKLRSMYVDAEERKAELMEHNKMDGLMFKMDNDPRITKVGKFIRKFSIDELPQFINVLKGDMSLIGTRPPTVAEFEQYESRHKRRLSMRPGITGMWQVSGRSDIQDFEEVVKLDCQYIDQWSPMLDTKIFFKTIKVVLTHEGAE